MTAAPGPGPGAPARLRVELEGLVQGVGLRPAVGRLARSLGLAGWVGNTAAGAAVEVEGEAAAVAAFVARLPGALPAHARLEGLRRLPRAATGERDFGIRPSVAAGERAARVPPDLATCPACLAEILDPANRRFGYPFTSCTDCGPRLSIARGLPWDRERTTMAGFTPCAACAREYASVTDRRCHHQANACPDCGPQLALRDGAGRRLAAGPAALAGAAAALAAGAIVALKGLGGYQLLVDARNAAAVGELRRRKQRPDKPFAVMLADLAAVATHCELGAAERALLAASAAPIVLLRRRQARREGAPATAVAPGNPWLGVMLPYTPLHHLLMRALGFAVVATSGNLGGEPIVSDDADALERLGGIADLWLTHDRPIAVPVDDSVARVVAGRTVLLRRARGHAPLTLPLPGAAAPLLALGGHLKSALAVARGGELVAGPHIGDLDGARARDRLDTAIGTLCELHGVRPAVVACDTHPDYHTSRVAARCGARVIRVPHHVAHVAGCMLEHGLDGPVLGIAWDGGGHGDDGTGWGGEALRIDGARWRRVARLRPLRLPGGERAVVEPRRVGLALLYEGFGAAGLDAAGPGVAAFIERRFSPAERPVLRRMLERGLHAPRTSSAGRLFDGVGALLGLVQRASFEGQAAMALEFAADGALADPAVADCALTDAGPLVEIDWRPLVRDLLARADAGVPVGSLAAAFHARLVTAIVAVARRAGLPRVVLSGGCFQNLRLLESTLAALREAGFAAWGPGAVPPNDGGLAIGQAAWAARVLRAERR